jgi:hypothetical protein
MASFYEAHKNSAFVMYEKSRDELFQSGLSVFGSHAHAKEKAVKLLKLYDLKTGTKYHIASEKELQLQIDSSFTKFQDDQKTKQWTFIGILGSILLLLVIFCSFCATFLCKRHRIHKMRNLESTVLYLDDRAWKIERERIDEMYSIGKGHFGEVFKGTLKPKQVDRDRKKMKS